MTSFTKSLYRRDPAAAMAFYHHQQFETQSTYGRTGLMLPAVGHTPAQPKPMQFGKRTSMPPVSACTTHCGHPACTNGCVALPRR